MATHIKNFRNRLQEAISNNPIEVVLSLLYFFIFCLDYDFKFKVESMMLYFPVVFLISYILNSISYESRFRPIYYLSALFFIPFIWIPENINHVKWIVSILVVVLLYLTLGLKRDNTAFLNNAFKMIMAFLYAFLLSIIIVSLLYGIYFSIWHIFEVFQNHNNRVPEYINGFSFLLALPLLFLMFNAQEKIEFTGSKIFNFLFNFILTPALLIYAVILYVYIFKIVITWSLPKGLVAIMVILFSIAAFILKGVQPMLKQRYYNWFFDRVSLFVLPALILFWVGTIYRVEQYGLTQDRVYLFLTGLFLTVCTFLFFNKRYGRYLYMAFIAIFLLSISTYIPGISAFSIGVKSQMARVNHAANELKLWSSDHKLTTSRNPVSKDTDQAYKRLYDAFKYVESQKGSAFIKQTYGIGFSKDLMQKVIPESKHEFVEYGVSRLKENELDFTIRGPVEVDCSGYRYMNELVYKNNYEGFARVKYESGIIYVWDKNNNLILRANKNFIYTSQLKKLGIDTREPLTLDKLEKYKNQLLQYETDSMLFIIKDITVSYGSSKYADGVELSSYFTK